MNLKSDTKETGINSGVSVDYWAGRAQAQEPKLPGAHEAFTFTNQEESQNKHEKK